MRGRGLVSISDSVAAAMVVVVFVEGEGGVSIVARMPVKGEVVARERRKRRRRGVGARNILFCVRDLAKSTR